MWRLPSIQPTHAEIFILLADCLMGWAVAEVNQKPVLNTSGSKVFHYQGESVMPKPKVSIRIPFCDSVVLENPRDGSR